MNKALHQFSFAIALVLLIGVFISCRDMRIPVKVATHSGSKLPLTPSSESLVDQYQSGNFKSIMFDPNCAF